MSNVHRYILGAPYVCLYFFLDLETYKSVNHFFLMVLNNYVSQLEVILVD